MKISLSDLWRLYASDYIYDYSQCADINGFWMRTRTNPPCRSEQKRKIKPKSKKKASVRITENLEDDRCSKSVTRRF